MSVDTACSSSLVATALARQTLTQPTTSAAASSALVGGINMMLLPTTTAMFQRAGMLAPDGRCKALDAAADGYVRAEAAAMMLLGLGDADKGPTMAVLAGVINRMGISDHSPTHMVCSNNTRALPARSHNSMMLHLSGGRI